MRRILRRLGVITVTVATLVAAVAVPAQADPTTGSITGVLTDATGAPVAGGVGVYADFTFVTSVGIDAGGNYRIDNLAPGGYQLNFFVDFTFSQWAHQKAFFHEADTFMVTAGATTVVNETVLATGSIAGTLAGGFADIFVSAQPTGQNAPAGFTRTDDRGQFQFSALLPGTYRLSFELSNGAMQFYPHVFDPNEAQDVTVVAGQRTEITDTLLPLGSASGRIVEDGAPVEGVQVQWFGPGGFPSMFTSTDADGRYRLPHVFASTYQVLVTLSDGRLQWAHGRLTQQDADEFPVAAGTGTVVDETVLPTGRVRIRAVDARTGAPITGFCIQVGLSMSACTDSEVATIDKVTAGRHDISVIPNADTHLGVFGGISLDVPAGGTADLTVRLTPAAIITAVVRDRSTGAPVADVCLEAITLVLASFPESGGARCSDERGHVRVGRLPAGTYTLFAQPRDGVHGLQWVGGNGGTGNQFAAWRVTLAAGQVVEAPTIRLDRAGTISGLVTGKTTGTPIHNAFVELLPHSPGLGPTGPTAITDETGRYTLTGLGPYDWPIHFAGFPFAPQWSGAAPSRLLAKPIRVTAGQTATADARLVNGTTVRGTVSAAGGPLREDAFVTAHDAVTGDLIASAFVSAGTGYELKVLGPMAIRIRVQGGVSLDGWHRMAADFAHASVVLVPSNGTKTVNLELR